ncbi:hypothetical protein [Paenibacillus agaridevorans]|uniref:hypothetical protein n=1 Tax=Paenibacillus agaridevorans TaxID=171404 RepID=UPI001BE4844B|nr:hypothetical protein [Paenibacillus agaridevorans]
MAYGPMFFSLTLLDSRKNDPNADWQAYPIVSIDDKPAYSQTLANAISNYYVINKNAKNSEAMFKIINVSIGRGKCRQIEGASRRRATVGVKNADEPKSNSD